MWLLTLFTVHEQLLTLLTIRGNQFNTYTTTIRYYYFYYYYEVPMLLLLQFFVKYGLVIQIIFCHFFLHQIRIGIRPTIQEVRYRIVSE